MLLEVNPIHQHSAADAKIRLFRSLFRGRDDVYPRRFESRKTGQPGYAPACGNEWIRGICEKPKIKCGDCQHQRFLPMTDEVIRWHLSGSDPAGQRFVAGIYPMLQDETCFFLAIDFRVNAASFYAQCSGASDSLSDGNATAFGQTARVYFPMSARTSMAFWIPYCSVL
jgi:hypothetical protein